MAIAPEASQNVEIRDASGAVLREVIVETDKPDPEMYGQVQIDHEPEVLPLNYAIAQLNREEKLMLYVRRELGSLYKAQRRR